MPPKAQIPYTTPKNSFQTAPTQKSQIPTPVHGKESWMKAEQLSSVGPLRKGRNASYLLSLWIILLKHILSTHIHAIYYTHPLHNACNL